MVTYLSGTGARLVFEDAVRATPIPTSKKDEEQVPVISADYGFFGAEGEDVEVFVSGPDAPILCVKDRRSKCIWAHPVPSKGVEDPWGKLCLAKDLEKTGYARVILKSDQEKALGAVLNSAKQLWTAKSGGEVILEKSPKGEKASNGEVERAVQEVHGLCRTFKEYLEFQVGQVLDPKWCIMTWLVEFAAVAYNILFVGDDGLTPFQRLKGKPWRVPLPAFGGSRRI